MHIQNIVLRKKTLVGLNIFVIIFSLVFSVVTSPNVRSLSLSSGTPISVGATYYGGEYNGQWVIDNVNQCSRIANGEFTASSLGAVVDTVCDDDNGLGYQNDVPLHNTVSFAELSNNPSSHDFSALGGLSAGTRVEIEYNGRCVVAEKRDVGLGGSAVNGHLRAIDLWWQTARSLGFTNGFDVVNVRLAGSTPLTPLGQSVKCSTPLSSQRQVVVDELTSQKQANNGQTSTRGNTKKQAKAGASGNSQSTTNTTGKVSSEATNTGASNGVLSTGISVFDDNSTKGISQYYRLLVLIVVIILITCAIWWYRFKRIKPKKASKAKSIKGFRRKKHRTKKRK